MDVAKRKRKINSCRLFTTELTGMSLNGDIIIGVVVPVHVNKVYPKIDYKEPPAPATCKTFRLENYQRVQAVHFAVEEINKDPQILPNISLGFQIFDSCTVLQRAISGTMQLLSGHGQPLVNYRYNHDIHLAAVIGHSISTYTMLLAHILGLYRYPQISHFSTSSLLSNRNQFRSFFRTVPSDAFQSRGLAQLVLHFGWTWIGLVAIDNDYGQQGIQMIKKDILKAGGCVAFTESISINQPDRNAPHIVQVIKESTATAVVIFSTDIDLVYVLDEMLKQNVTGKTWIASEAWATSAFLSVPKYSKLLHGTIGFALHSGKMPGFGDFLNRIYPSMSVGKEWIKIFWEEVFTCKFLDKENQTTSLPSSVKECTGEECLSTILNSYNDISGLRVTYNIYIAVHVVARALQDLTSCRQGDGPFLNGTCADMQKFQPWQLLSYMKKIHLKLTSGREVFFNENGDPPAAYDIINWQLSQDGRLQHVIVGSYDTGNTAGNIFNINASLVQWGAENKKVPMSVCSQSCPPGFRKVTIHGQPVCCFQCVLCPFGEISNQSDSVDCNKCPWDMWPNSAHDRCVPKTREFLAYDDPLGQTLTSTSISSSLIPLAIFGLFIHYKSTPIVRANNYFLSCLLLVSLCLCFLCSLVFIGFPHPEKCLLRQVTFGIVFVLCISGILAKTIMVVIAFKATRPGSPLRKWTSPIVSYLIVFSCVIIQAFLCIAWLVIAPPFLQFKTEINSDIITVECNEGSVMAFWSMLGFLGILASISFVVAFLARRLPDSFNEAKFITFSMLAFLSVWISYIPASLSSKGRYTVAMEIFAIQSSSWALVICIFLPKCFNILFRPKMNSKEHLMGRDKKLTNKN
ncbi:extracellular calcium-sensing receptor-like [Lithobates pipiens]